MKIAAVVALLVTLALAPAIHATVTSSQGFSAPNLVLADAIPTGNINTSSIFELQDWSTTHNSFGIFAGLPLQDFGNVFVHVTSPTGLHFGDAQFGDFTSLTITTSSTGPGFLDILAVGKFDPGTDVKTTGNDVAAEIRIALTQTPPASGEISASGTMSITPAPVAEPTTLLLFGSGILGIFAAIKVHKGLV